MARTKTNRNRSLPGFMQAANRMPSRLLTNSPRRVQQQRRLDANTAAQISYRRRLSAATPPPPLSNTASKTTTGTTEISEPIRDPDPEDKTQDSLAHRAAGFLVDGEKVDMAAVLTGMGALPQKTAA